MNIYQMMAQRERQRLGMPGYAWRIDVDNFYERECGIDDWESAAGVVGPSDARTVDDDGETIDTSFYPYHHVFRMYDDDGELYYTGTLYWEGGEEPEEHQVYGPLGDFGGGSGCVVVKYHGKPEWDCG